MVFGVKIDSGPTYDQLGIGGANPQNPSGGTANSMGANLPQPYQNTGGATPWDPSGGTANSQGANFMPPDQLVSSVTPNQGFASNQPGAAAVGGGIGGGGGGAPQAPVTPPPPPRTYHDYLPGGSQFGQLIADGTYVNQKAALINKLNDYERNVAGQIGNQNLTAITDANDPLTGSVYGYNGRALAANGLFNPVKDINGDIDYRANTDALGGTLGKQYDTALANFNNQQAQGLRNNSEDFAARGMLGSGSGVWQTATKNLQDQYNNQLGNINDSTVNQYNSLLGSLADQFSQGRNTLQGYAGDAANRLASGYNSSLPTSV